MCRTQSLYADVIADFMAQETEFMQVTIEGMKPATLGPDSGGPSKVTSR